MFTVELKFASSCLLIWFNKKFKIQNMEKDHNEKILPETFNPIDWKKTKRVICKFPLIINAKGPDVPANKMIYTDFYIRYGHNFLRKIYSKKELETSKELKSLECYYEVFDKFLTIVILLESVINHGTFSKTNKEKLSNFIKEHLAGTENYHEIADKIKETKIRRFDSKMSKLSQQLYAYIHGCQIEFPKNNTEYETVTTGNFLRNAYRMIKLETNLYHSDPTGKILGYVHDFCNRRVRDNKTEFSCMAHNFWGFNMSFFIEGYRATTWNSRK